MYMQDHELDKIDLINDPIQTLYIQPTLTSRRIFYVIQFNNY